MPLADDIWSLEGCWPKEMLFDHAWNTITSPSGGADFNSTSPDPVAARSS